MKLGVYNAILHDRPLPEALKVIADLGLTGIEINTGIRSAFPKGLVIGPFPVRPLCEHAPRAAECVGYVAR